MDDIRWNKLFPTKGTAVIFVSYILLFVMHGLMVTATQGSNNEYGYNIESVVILTEVLKLVLSVLLYSKDNTLSQLYTDIRSNSKLLGLYFIPAFLYCLYNLLTFTNLATFDPTTYSLLLQIRVVITGVVFQILFKQYLSKIQWVSMVVLTIGCMLKQVEFGASSEAVVVNKNMKGFDLSMSTALIVIQVLCSCFAGVYNEYLLKTEGASVNIYVQNVFMYLDSIICNLVVLVFKGDVGKAVSLQNFQVIFQYTVLILILNTAVVGIITSFFLQELNSIMKTFASALELIIMPILCLFLFGIPIYLNTVLSIAVVCFAIILYSKNPVNNTLVVQVKEFDEVI